MNSYVCLTKTFYKYLCWLFNSGIFCVVGDCAYLGYKKPIWWMKLFRVYTLLWFSYVIFKTISNEAKVYFRQLEKTAKRLTKVEEHVKFNENCMKEDLLPRYTTYKKSQMTSNSPPPGHI